MAATPRQRGLLAGGVRRRGLRLRRTPASTARWAASRSTSPWWAWRPPPTAAGTGWWPRTAASSPSATPASTARWAATAQPAGRRHGRHPPTVGVLAGGGGRRHLRLRRRPVLRLDRRHNLNQPIVGMTATPTAGGYWFTAADGGSSPSATPASTARSGNVPQSRPIVAITADADGQGYWFTNNNGAVTPFGDATYWGSAPQVLNRPVVGIAEATGNGSFTGSSYPSGSFGYDISNYQCAELPALAPHHRDRPGGGRVLGSPTPVWPEATWAGGGLNLYVYLTYGAAASSTRPGLRLHGRPRPATTASTPPWTPSPTPRRPASTPRWPGGWTWSRHPRSAWSSTAANAALIRGPSTASTPRASTASASTPAPATGRHRGHTTSRPSPTGPPTGRSTRPPPAQNVQVALLGGLPDRAGEIVQYSSPSIALSYGGMNTAFDDDYAC